MTATRTFFFIRLTDLKLSLKSVMHVSSSFKDIFGMSADQLPCK